MGKSEPTGRDVVEGFAGTITAAREAAGWSMAELARRAGLSVNTVSAVEREIRAPSLRVASALARALDIRAWVADPATPVRDVFRYDPEGAARGTVKAEYLRRRANGSPPGPACCDNERCHFHANPLVWNGTPLTLVLDHINGVSGDNRVENLRLLCPNCNSQLPTHGGGNKGRVEMAKGGYSVKRPDGLRDYTIPAETGRYRVTGGAAGGGRAAESPPPDPTPPGAGSRRKNTSVRPARKKGK